MDKYIANTDIESGYSYIMGPDNFEAWFQLPSQYDQWYQDSSGVIAQLNTLHKENEIMKNMFKRINNGLGFGVGLPIEKLKAIINDAKKEMIND